MNTVKLIGNVGGEVFVRDFENGRKVSFSLATHENYLNRNQEEVETTTWHTVIVWGKLARECEALLSKGKFLQIEGKINYREYKNKENQTVRLTEIVAGKIEEGPRKAVAA